MQLVQFTDFRNNASRYLDMVEHQGEMVQILRSGKPVGLRLEPVRVGL